MFTLSDLKPIMHVVQTNNLCCAFPDTNCEGETRPMPARGCDPPPSYVESVERGGTMDRASEQNLGY